jgi:membrane-associated protein
MGDIGSWINDWGYLAIAVIVVLGNVGVPVPEETILLLAGYLVLEGKLRFPLVALVGVLSAVAGDNLGFWFGRKFGRNAIERYEQWIFISPKQLEWTQSLMRRYGPLAVFVARFVPVLRFLAGPVAGITGLPPFRFMLANLLGASVYVPLVVGAGYGITYGIKDYLFRLEGMIGHLEHYLPLLAVLLTAVFFAWRRLRVLRDAQAAGMLDSQKSSPDRTRGIDDSR